MLCIKFKVCSGKISNLKDKKPQLREVSQFKGHKTTEHKSVNFNTLTLMLESSLTF